MSGHRENQTLELERYLFVPASLSPVSNEVTAYPRTVILNEVVQTALDPLSASSLLDNNYDVYVHPSPPHLVLNSLTAPFTPAHSTLSMSCTDDICHIAAEAMELEFHLPHLLTNRRKKKNTHTKKLSLTRLSDTFLKYNGDLITWMNSFPSDRF